MISKAIATSTFAALFSGARILVSAQTDRAVYAHFMVGIVRDYTVDDWKADMVEAKAIGIDGFALNCAPPRVDSYTPDQLANAYEAAGQSNFTVFISFDFAYWQNDDTALITSFLANYSSHPGQAKYDGGQIASTFVGDSFDWGPVKSALGSKLTALPTSRTLLRLWLAWPTDGGNSIIPGPMTTTWDDRFVEFLDDRIYMAPVSPWFSTHFNSKNWVFICEELITDRWEQMLALKPTLIEIITWNDYGESHYIAGPEPNHDDDGSSQWADGFPHDGWRHIMKPYIAAYKAGADTPTVEEDELVYWYRPTPKDTKCTNDTLPAPQGIQLLADVIFVTTMLTEAASLTVTSGTQAPVTIDVAAGIVTKNFTMGVGKQSFSLTRNGAKILGGDGGLDISSSCTKYNFNAYVGSFGPSGSSSSSTAAPVSTDMPATTSTSDSTASLPTTADSTASAPSSSDPPATDSSTSSTPSSTPTCDSSSLATRELVNAPAKMRRIFKLGRFSLEIDE
ncbi:glycosyl hydrolase family 71-domain-containing protein [Auriculariales sp. MPI-PUGE-AT-0066]|nr:glycosyl hydrolase family 71-domain-containing protein [Auriculariales sp. MPI-PUGE-AT-0066]